ncbi:MAG: phage recombination protein Bet [Peptococcaceae bacterium]|nr:phage recombination protein Bet [Peptococcaceae bacterium]
MSNALMASFKVNGSLVELDAATVRDYLTNGSGKPTDQEVAMFIKLCQHQGLNPFLREAYLIKYSDKNPATTVVGKDAFTRRATEIKDCKGWKAGVCCVEKKSGKYLEREGTIVLDSEILVGGWCEVKTTRWEEPFKQTAQLSEYHQHNSMWNGKPATMIRKVAIVQTLREAFPAQFQGMYDQSEIDTKGELPDEVIDVTPQSAAEPEPEVDQSKLSIDGYKKKELAALMGDDEEKIEIAKKVVTSYGYESVKDILNGDYDDIVAALQDAFAELDAAEELVDPNSEAVNEETTEAGEPDAAE